MKRKIVLITVVIGMQLLSVLVFAETQKKETGLKAAMLEFKKGAYAQALEVLDKSPAHKNDELPYKYWRGVFNFKLQKFTKAIKELKQVVSQDTKSIYKDAPYMLGQSYYATQDFKLAIAPFQKSIKNNYKVGASTYYVGYIENLLEKNDQALKTLSKVLALPKDDSEMRQAAAFQIGEIHFEKAQKMKKEADRKKYFTQTVIPAYEAAIGYDNDSILSRQARGRIQDVSNKAGVKGTSASTIPRTANGTARPVHSWVIRFTQDFKYDSNIVNQPDGKLVQISNTGAPLSKTGFSVKYEHVFRDWIVATPGLSTDMTWHGRRGTSSVFSNDNTSISPSLRFRLDHMISKKPAAGLLEYEFAYTTRDYRGLHKQSYYTRSSNFIVGERYDLFSFGQTTLKGNIKLSENQMRDLNFIGPGASLTQNFKTFKSYVLSTTFDWEYQMAKASFFDQRSYKLNASHGFPQLFWGTSFDPNISLTVIDTANQMATRGWETNITPGFSLTKFFDRESRIGATFSYSYTRNFSKNQATYDFSKHIAGLGMQVTL